MVFAFFSSSLSNDVLLVNKHGIYDRYFIEKRISSVQYHLVLSNYNLQHDYGARKGRNERLNDPSLQSFPFWLDTMTCAKQDTQPKSERLYIHRGKLTAAVTREGNRRCSLYHIYDVSLLTPSDDDISKQGREIRIPILSLPSHKANK